MTKTELSSYSLWTALVTPFDEKGKLHLANLKHLLQRQEKAENGIVLLGSTGEGLALAPEEQRTVVEFACSLSLKVPLLVGVGGFQLPHVLKWLHFCREQKNIQGYLMPTPLYAKPGPKGQYHWFKTLLDEAHKPCMIYNIPSRAGQSLSMEAALSLAEHPNFWSLKEASGSVDTFRNYHQNLPGITMYSGDDSMTYDFVPAGCQGLVSVASNIWPHKMHSFVTRCLRQDIPTQKKTLINQACESLFLASNPIPAKVLLHHKKEIDTPTARPPLTHEEMTSLAPLLKADHTMTETIEGAL